MLTTDQHIIQIKLLKQKLSNQEMSVLIGAGFSKNVSDIFPSWWQLLFDLTYFLFKDDIEQSYITLPSKNRKNKPDYINERVDHYVKKLGFLDIASEYIKRKGFVESITTYIEEKTPRLIQENDKYFLTNILDQKKNKVELTPAMLSQHRALIRLPWNNIYTTNYDEMLEFANKTNSEQDINNEIQNLQNEISELEQSVINIQRDINDEINAIQNPKEDSLPGIDIPRASNLNSSTRKDRRQLEYDLSEVKKNISSKERDLIDFNKALGDCISVVTDSSELSVKRNKNIIKLHGTLRADENPFGFDGDVRKHYIISKEDFHTYPQKHEAFTQLMRISLLQESYCLIGFSGVDPNFIEWVKWVRDILERKRNIDPQNQYKIFLISLDNKEPDEDEKLFYRNYKVYRLPIANENVINFLEEQTGIKVENRESKKEILETFFNYLSLEINVSSPQFTIDKINLNKYDKVWESIKITNPNNIRVTDYASQMNELTMFKKHSRIPGVNNLYAQNKHLLINFAKNIIEKNKEHSELLIKVTILAMRDLFVIPSFVWENNDIKYISALASKNPDIKKELNLFFLRDAVLSNDTTSFNRIKKKLDSSEDRVIYEEILNFAFNLDFKNLRKKLNDWNASSHWLLKKAGFVALFDLNEAEKLIESYHFSESESVHEQIHFYQIFKFIRVSNLSHDEKLNRKITALKKLGLSDLDEILSSITNKLTPKPEKITPYGTGRFSVYNGKTFSGGLDSQTKALQYLQLLIESGYPLKIGYTYLKTSDEWYNIFKLIFEIIPQPCLFYTLQYSDKDVLARAAQDYINSESLTSETYKVLPELLAIYLDVNTPEQFKHNILHFCAELFPAVDPKSWQPLIYKIWKLDSFKSKALDDFYSAEYSFIKSAIWYIEDDKIIKKIIEDILINYNHLEGESDARVNLLYRTTNKKLKSTANYVKEIKPLIDHVIHSLLDNLEGWFIVINIHSLLSSNQKSRINKKILLLNYDGIKYSNLWYILTFFANTDESKKLIKSKVIDNNLFWNATKTTISYNHYIPLYLITQKNGNEIGLEWTKDEMNAILKKLNALINGWKVNDEDRHDFKSLLQELNKFIDMTQDKFKSLPNHTKTANILLPLYKESRGYDTIIAGLLSNQKSIIIWALSDLSYLIKEYPNHSEIFSSIPILINKILLQSEPAIEASLNYLAVWINDDKNIETFKPYVNLLILILKKYKEEPLINSDQLFVQRQLIVIAMVLSKWKVKDSIINEWIEIRNESKYFSNRNINLDRVY